MLIFGCVEANFGPPVISTYQESDVLSSKIQ